MSLRGSLDHVTLLREAIARIEREAAPSRDHDAQDADAIAFGSGGLALDRVLGGGLRRGTLHEIVPASARDEGAASRFTLGVAARGQGRDGTLVWIVDACAASESGAPYRPGLSGHGIDPDRLIVVRTRGAQQTLWAAEEALRGSTFLVLVELWAGRDYGLLPSRRLVLAARTRGATALLLHTGLGAAARALSTTCETRLVVAAQPSRRRPAAGGLPVPGPPAFHIRLDKARVTACAIDPDTRFSLYWTAEQRSFHDVDPPVALAASSADRPARTGDAGRG